MKFLDYEVDLGSNDVVEVTLDAQANIKLMDNANFSDYRNGRKHHFYGGLAKRSPVRIQAPSAGHWHVVVDLGGYAGHVSASVRVLSA